MVTKVVEMEEYELLKQRKKIIQEQIVLLKEMYECEEKILEIYKERKQLRREIGQMEIELLKL